MRRQTVVAMFFMAAVLIALIGANGAQACLCSGACIFNEDCQDWMCGFGFVDCTTCGDQLGICVEHDCDRGANTPALRKGMTDERLACNAPNKREPLTPVVWVIAVEHLPSRT